MKTSKTLLLALAVAVASVAGNAMASSTFYGFKLNVSGTAKYQNEYDSAKGTVNSKSFSEKSIYLLVSNAVANTDTGYATNLPKDGYIVFNPNGDDGTVDGTFYVTNHDGFYYPLSGYDTNSTPEYYSFIELDTIIYYDYHEGMSFGFYDYYDDIFQSVDSYNLNADGNGSDTTTAKALLYVHDDPYDYADSTLSDGDYYPFNDENENAIEISGILTANFTIKDGEINKGSLSLHGDGNFILDNYDYYGVVSTGHASFNP